MKAIETLEREHRVIEQVASACGVCAEVLRRGANVPTDVLESIVEFFRQYGDRYHRQAEEALLALLHERGVPTGACPVVVINYDNQKRKTLVDQLCSAVSAYIKSGGAEKVLSEEDKRSLADSLNLIDSMKGMEARQAAEKCSTAIRRPCALVRS